MDLCHSNGPPLFNPNDHGPNVARAFEQPRERFKIDCDLIFEDVSHDDLYGGKLETKFD